MENSRSHNIEILAGNGKLEELKELLASNFSQHEIDIALSNALAYSQIDTAKHLIKLGADISWGDHDGVYYAVHNNEFEGLRFSLSQGIDININNGMILNTCVMTCINSKDNKMLEWIINKGVNLSLLSQDMKRVAAKFGNEELKKILNIMM